MNKELIISLIRNVIKNGSFEVEENIDEDTLRVLKEQTFMPFLQYSSKKEEYKKYYLSSFLLHEQFLKIKNIITSTFNQAHIDHVYLKGIVLENIYPDKNLRLHGDIDLLVRKNELNKAISLLKEKGFILDGSEAHHHICLRYNNIEVELHHSLVASFEKDHSFFKDAFGHIELVNEHEYVISPTYHFIFLISHYIRHIINGGAGLRELIDFYLVLKKYKIDMDEVNVYLYKYKYKKIFETFLSEIEIIFEEKLYNYEFNEYASSLIDFSLDAGIHGFGLKNNKRDNFNKNHSKHKFKYLFKTLFIPVSRLFREYPFTKSIILIPLGYIVRFFYLLTHKKDKLDSLLKEKDTLDINKYIGLE